MQADPTIIMLDQFVRVALGEALKATIWVAIAVGAVKVFFRRHR